MVRVGATLNDEDWDKINYQSKELLTSSWSEEHPGSWVQEYGLITVYECDLGFYQQINYGEEVWIAPKSADLTKSLVNFVRDNYLHVAFAAHFHLKAEPFKTWKKPIVRSIKQTYWITLNSHRTNLFREVDEALQRESKKYRKLVSFFEDPESPSTRRIKEDFLLFDDFRGIF